MTQRILLLGNARIDTKGLDITLDDAAWDFIIPFQKYDMIIIDNASLDSKTVKIAKNLKEDFRKFVQAGGVIVCLSSEPKNYGGYRTYDWLPLVKPVKPQISKFKGNSFKIKESMYERFIEQMGHNMSPECVFSGIQDKDDCKVLLTTGYNDNLAFSINIGQGILICFPQFNDKQEFLRKWVEFWFSKKPDWADKYEYRLKKTLKSKLRIIKRLEKLLYGNDRELRNAVVEALRIIGFDAKPLTVGTQQDIDVTYGSFRAIVEVKGLKSQADRDDMRALLDYYDANITKQSNLKGIFVVNHYREIEPTKRESAYTMSAIELAERKKFCLLTADDIYFAIEKAFEREDLKETLRNQIMQGIGPLQLCSMT
ncbi:MAG: hypothetical protein QXX17_03215 [Conexivisphaerales archaeon]